MMMTLVQRGALALCSLAFAAATAAHEIRPAIVTASFEAGNRIDIGVTANLEALLVGIGPQHADTDQSPLAAKYDELRALPPAELERRFEAFAPRWLEGIKLEFDGKRIAPVIAAIEIPGIGELGLARISTVRLDGQMPSGAKVMRWTYAAEFGSSVLRVKAQDGGDPVTSWLKDGATSEPVPVGGAVTKSTLKLMTEYLVLGFTHILPKGLDHILFVLGLYLLSTQWRPLLVQVTAFTIAHSITLALGLYGVVALSPAIVEPLIAASIVYVAVENIMTSKLQTWRPFIVFGFGLLHGLGFAGVLQDIDLPRADFATALIAFNVGVELAQLTVIALAFLATGLWFRNRAWYRTRIVWPASAAIALAGVYWSVERVFFG